MVVCVECLPADKPWDVVSVTRRSSGLAPRACVRVYARVLVPPNLYIHTYIHTYRIVAKACHLHIVALGRGPGGAVLHGDWLKRRAGGDDGAAARPFIGLLRRALGL